MHGGSDFEQNPIRHAQGSPHYYPLITVPPASLAPPATAPSPPTADPDLSLTQVLTATLCPSPGLTSVADCMGGFVRATSAQRTPSRLDANFLSGFLVRFRFFVTFVCQNLWLEHYKVFGNLHVEKNISETIRFMKANPNADSPPYIFHLFEI